MNNEFLNEKDYLRKINTSISMSNYSKNNRAPYEIRSILDHFDKSVNPFLDLNEKEENIENIDKLYDNNARLSLECSEDTCMIEISSLAGSVKYSYNPDDIEFTLKTNLYEVTHRYKLKSDYYSSGEDLIIKTKNREFEYNLTSGVIYNDSYGNFKNEVRSANYDDISSLYLRLFYYVDKANSIAYENLNNNNKVKEMK